MKLIDSYFNLSFNKNFSSHVRNYVHSILDAEQIPHYILQITSSSVVVCVDLVSSLDYAHELLLQHPFAKHSSIGIDEDGEPWIEIFF